MREYLDCGGLRGPVGEGQGHLPVSEGLRGVRPEGQLGAEHGLALQPRALAHEQVVVVTLEICNLAITMVGDQVS